MRVIGLTGMYCAGKNHVGGILNSLGFPVLDVDKQGHEVIEIEKQAIVSRFGTEILGPDGKIDRKILGKLVFGKPKDMADLEGIVHPVVNAMTLQWIDAQKTEVAVINAALLHRSSAFSRLDFIILVQAPFLTRLIRARKRDALPWRDLYKRIISQKKFTSQYLSQGTDIYFIYNQGSFRLFTQFWRRNLEKQIRTIISKTGMVRDG